MVFEEYRKFMHSLVARPTNIDEVEIFFEDDEESERRAARVRKEILAKPPEELNFGELQTVLDIDAELEKNFWYLPYAFEYLHAQKRCCDQLAATVFRVVGSMLHWRAPMYPPPGFVPPKFPPPELCERTLDCIIVVFDKWVSQFELLTAEQLRTYHHEDFRFTSRVVGYDDLSEFLFELEFCHFPYQGEGIFRWILSKWSQQPSCPAASANLLHMCAVWKHLGERESEHPSVQAMANDKALLRRHYENCRGLWDDLRAPEDYRARVLDLLGLG